MFIHTDSHFSIYFGGAQDELMPPYYLNLPDHPLLEIEPFSKLKEKMKLKSLVFLHQTHSDHGLVVIQNNVATIRPFKSDGDYLITSLKHTGIGVMTADCLPVILYDNRAQVVSVIHAGWRGSVLGVVVKALERMQELYNTQAKNVSAYFGPSALICCYEVSRGFESNLEGFSWNDKRKTLIERDNKLFFDVSLFNRLQLEAAGVQRINTEYNVCTMCTSSLYSHRRDASRAGRQMTVVSLI